MCSMDKIWKCRIYTLLSGSYFVLFVFSYYVLMFIHTREIYKFKTKVIVFYIGNYFPLYILVLLVRITHASQNRSLFRVRTTKELTEKELNESFNPFFTEMILKNRTETMRICDRCNVYMPPRAHHCDICDACFMKMDHHSLFLNVCIGHLNYKYYYLFLLTNWTYGLFQFVVLMYHGILNYQTSVDQVFYILGAISNGIITLISFIFFVIHTKLLLYNETWIERKAINSFIRGKDDYKGIFQEGLLSMKESIDVKNRKILNPYFVSYMDNVKDVFGDKYYSWVLPYFTGQSNGISFTKHKI